MRKIVAVILLVIFVSVISLFNGVIKAEPNKVGNNGDELKVSSPNRGYAVFENLDAGNYTNDTGQSVYMVAENILGGMYYNDILILNNVRPDVFLNFYVLQNGTVYPPTRVPYIAYTSTSYSYFM